MWWISDSSAGLLHPGQLEVTIDSTVEELQELSKVIGLDVPARGGWGHGKLVEEIWEVLCEDQLEGPSLSRTSQWSPPRSPASIVPSRE